MKMNMNMNMKGRTCELCNEEASLYCPSDSAFLCSKCDATVHEANFLVARHLRYFLCYKCNRFSAAASCSTCLSCSPEIPSDSLPSSSSSAAAKSCAIATATASEKIKLNNNTTKKKRTKSCSSSVTDDASSTAEQGGSVFVKWSRELGLGANGGNRVESLASQALGFCLGKWKTLPFRVAAATSFWFGIRFYGFHNQNKNLVARLEAISGVPAKLILAAHAKLARVFTQRCGEFHLRQQQQEEGWDES